MHVLCLFVPSVSLNSTPTCFTYLFLSSHFYLFVTHSISHSLCLLHSLCRWLANHHSPLVSYLHPIMTTSYGGNKTFWQHLWINSDSRFLLDSPLCYAVSTGNFITNTKRVIFTISKNQPFSNDPLSKYYQSNIFASCTYQDQYSLSIWYQLMYSPMISLPIQPLLLSSKQVTCIIKLWSRSITIYRRSNLVHNHTNHQLSKGADTLDSLIELMNLIMKLYLSAIIDGECIPVCMAGHTNWMEM